MYSAVLCVRVLQSSPSSLIINRMITGRPIKLFKFAAASAVVNDVTGISSVQDVTTEHSYFLL